SSTESQREAVIRGLIFYLAEETEDLIKDYQNPNSLQLEVTNLPIYQSGKGYKAISKALGLPRTTVRGIIYKWRKHGTVENLPRSGRPTKITPRAQRQLIQEVTKDPTTTCKELQASLASVKQDNDPKHSSKSTSEWLKKNKMKTLEWPSQSPDLNPIEMLWHDLKKVVHARKPSNVAELQQFCKDEWAKIPPQRCNRLIASYGKRLIAVVAAKAAPPALAPPQGCVLSPLLFSLYTNDCTSIDPSVKLLKFADDTTVIGLIQDGDESAYRQEIEQLAAWCSLNNLELNTLKTVEMIVDFRRNTPALPPLTIMNSTVPIVESLGFLGTTISQDLKWDIHIDATIKKAQQRLYFLRQLRKFNLPQELLIHFYSAVIESVLCTSITVWFDSATKSDMRRLQRTVRTAERIIGAPLPTPFKNCIHP
ncbi:hypothetical protein QTP70_031163, partial [Hemibagrus guttatus]